MTTPATKKLINFSAYCYPDNKPVIDQFTKTYDISLGSCLEILVLGMVGTMKEMEIQKVIDLGKAEKMKKKTPDGRTQRSDLLKRIGMLTAAELATVEAARAAKSAE